MLDGVLQNMPGVRQQCLGIRLARMRRLAGLQLGDIPSHACLDARG